MSLIYFLSAYLIDLVVLVPVTFSSYHLRERTKLFHLSLHLTRYAPEQMKTIFRAV